MAKERIYDLSKELGVSPKDILDLLTYIGVPNKVASSSVEEIDAAKLRQLASDNIQTPKKPLPMSENFSSNTSAKTEDLSVSELGHRLMQSALKLEAQSQAVNEKLQRGQRKNEELQDALDAAIICANEQTEDVWQLSA